VAHCVRDTEVLQCESLAISTESCSVSPGCRCGCFCLESSHWFDGQCWAILLDRGSSREVSLVRRTAGSYDPMDWLRCGSSWNGYLSKLCSWS